MTTVKMFFTNGTGNVETIEKVFADFVVAVKFFNDIHKYIKGVSHAKLIAHRRVVDEF